MLHHNFQTSYFEETPCPIPTQIAAGVCLLIFVGQLFNLIRMRRQMRATASWSKTEGVITVFKVDQPRSSMSASAVSSRQKNYPAG
jgi:hypothetical protein